VFVFAEFLDEATSEYIPAAQEDLALNLEITDMIKSRRVAAKDAMRYLKHRILHANPNVQLLALQLVDKCVKNGGKHFLVEVAGREFVDELVAVMSNNAGRNAEDTSLDDSFGVTIHAGTTVNPVVQQKLIEYFQTWSLLLQSDPDLAYLTDTYNELHRQSVVRFPSPAASIDHLDPTALVSTLAPPEWTDAAECQRCRTAFSFSNRKHHCRRCGGTFCQLCSERSMPLLDMGIIEAVRVCDSCYTSSIPSNTPPSHRPKPKPTVLPEDLAFKKAIELSLVEQQHVAPPSVEEEKQLKAAIEASLQDSHASRSPATHRPDSPTAKLFTAIELDNITLFSSLIARLLLTRPQIPAEDAQDLQSLAGEMRNLQRRLDSFQRAHGLSSSPRLMECAQCLKTGLEGLAQLNLTMSATDPMPIEQRRLPTDPREQGHLPIDPREQRRPSIDPMEQRLPSTDPRRFSTDPMEQRLPSTDPRRFSTDPGEQRRPSIDPMEQRLPSTDPTACQHTTTHYQEAGTGNYSSAYSSNHLHQYPSAPPTIAPSTSSVESALAPIEPAHVCCQHSQAPDPARPTYVLLPNGTPINMVPFFVPAATKAGHKKKAKKQPRQKTEEPEAPSLPCSPPNLIDL